ncbi:helix-turn-helix domain-containing protein [Burkholderia sp. B21-005]|uniref:helix-turn-helix domain-containing protein n=1 Tax=Burkholderia sp. B21-005 TaxID=2890406 RepID=UPI001E382550|nr:hypothetical protein [Burkholderia sp. B21-005]UEP42716.1 hypothetical protein LMA02_07110 [Burkholderia sp. B21-005]
MKLGELLKSRREALGMTLDDVADALTELRRIVHELRTYNPAADEYKGAHIHKVWAREIEALIAVEQHEAAPADAKDAMDTLVAVLNAIGYTEEFAAAHPDLKVSEGVKLFLSQQTQAAPLEGTGNGADERAAMVRARAAVFDWQGEHGITLTVGAINDLARLLVDAGEKA